MLDLLNTLDFGLYKNTVKDKFSHLTVHTANGWEGYFRPSNLLALSRAVLGWGGGLFSTSKSPCFGQGFPGLCQRFFLLAFEKKNCPKSSNILEKSKNH